MANKYDDYIGCRASFHLTKENGDFSGQIQSIDAENEIVTFYKVTLELLGKPPKVFGGLQHYYSDEIRDLTVHEDEVNKTLRQASLQTDFENLPKPKKTKSIRSNKVMPKHLQNLQEFLPDLYMRSIVEAAIGQTKNEDGSYESVLPPDCTLLDDANSQLFKDAIAHLKKCSSIAVSFEGVKLGRGGKLSWILISTAEHTMFFDILTMGKECFQAGIQGILQSPHITKVIHDCRLPSDLLHHQYNTKLVNVFDTQVAAVHVYKMDHKGDFPRYISSLADCLCNELNINKEDIHYPVVRGTCPEKDEEVYCWRPSPTIVYGWMHQHCHHLLDLQVAMMDTMLMEFKMGVDIYLRNLRDASKVDSDMRMAKQHLLPTEFTGLPRVVLAHLQDRTLKKRRIPLKYQASAQRDEHGSVENCSGISHPQLIASHDTIWHTTSHSRVTQSDRKAPPQQTEKSSVEPNSDSRGNASEASRMPRTTPLNQSRASSQGGVGGKSKSSKELGTRELSPADNVLLPSVGTDSSHKAPVVDQKEQNEQVKREEAVALLNHLTKMREENVQKGNLFPQSMRYVFRPAGDSVQNLSKRKQKELEEAQTVSPRDLASREVESRQRAKFQGLVGENEFDLIPSHTQLEQKRPKKVAAHSNQVFVSADKPSVGEEGGFRIDSFKAIPPPPLYGPCEDSGQPCAKEALAAILPHVENQSQLLEGSRSCASRNTSIVTALSFSDSGSSTDSVRSARQVHDSCNSPGLSSSSLIDDEPKTTNDLLLEVSEGQTSVGLQQTGKLDLLCTSTEAGQSGSAGNQAFGPVKSIVSCSSPPARACLRTPDVSSTSSNGHSVEKSPASFSANSALNRGEMSASCNPLNVQTNSSLSTPAQQTTCSSPFSSPANSSSASSCSTASQEAVESKATQPGGSRNSGNSVPGHKGKGLTGGGRGIMAMLGVTLSPQELFMKRVQSNIAEP